MMLLHVRADRSFAEQHLAVFHTDEYGNTFPRALWPLGFCRLRLH